MKLFILVVLLLSSILESTLISFPITLVLVSVFALIYGMDLLWPYFVSGIIVDLLNIWPVGASSLFFLLILKLSERYQRKIHLGAIFYPLLFFLAVSSFYNLIFYRQLRIAVVVNQTILGLIWLMFSSRLFPEKVSDKKRLTV